MTKTRNITVALDIQLAKWVKVWAAKHDKSISSILAELLHEKRKQDQSYVRAMSSYLNRKRKPISDGSPYPSRDQLYE